MFRLLSVLILVLVLSCCAAATQELCPICPISKPYGASAPYGEGIHPGIDYGIQTGTPIISVANGRVVYTEDQGMDGLALVVSHGQYFRVTYAHLSRLFVEKGQWLKRGQLIGLSGESNSYKRPRYEHLHFGLSRIGPGDTHNYSMSYDPQEYWLGGKPQCFDPKLDYTPYTQRDITLPIACGTHAESLIAEAKGRK